eukprot:16441928-Heterocapsa_arctica.AAC.1
MASLSDFGVYVEEDEDKVWATGVNIIKTGWVATRKSPERVKLRTVVQEVNRGSWVDAFSPTPTPIGQRLLLAIAAHDG